MKKTVLSVCVFMIYLGWTQMSAAQSITQTADLNEMLITALQTAKPNWHYEQTDAIAGTENVLLQTWTSESQRVRIAIVPHKSQDDALKAIQDISRYGQIKEILPGVGDAGFSWGRGTVAFTTRNLTVYVSSVIVTPVFDVKAAKANLVEEHDLSKEFTHLVAEAIRAHLNR